jgi:hypothetical protein
MIALIAAASLAATVPPKPYSRVQECRMLGRLNPDRARPFDVRYCIEHPNARIGLITSEPPSKNVPKEAAH